MATNQVTQTVTAEQHEQFDRDGFLKFDPEIPDKVLDRVISDLAGHYRFEVGADLVTEEGVRFSAGPNPRIADAWKISEAVHQITLAPKVLALLEGLYGRRPKPFQTLNFMSGTEQAAHVDGMYFNSVPQGWMCGVWVALENIDMDNGPLIYYPGSHKLPLPTWDELGEIDRAGFDDYNAYVNARVSRYQNHVAEQVKGYPRQAEYGTIERGQALVWAAHLIHGGSPQRDKSRTRHSQVTHYYFEGDDIRHAWPLGKEGDRTQFKYPGWITWDTPKKITPDVVKEVVRSHVPDDAAVAVATGGDEAMLDLEGRRAAHFPRQGDGSYLPPQEITAEEAIAQVERLKAEGLGYLVFQGTMINWLASPQSGELQQHIEGRYRSVVRDGATCVIFALG